MKTISDKFAQNIACGCTFCMVLGSCYTGLSTPTPTPSHFILLVVPMQYSCCGSILFYVLESTFSVVLTLRTFSYFKLSSGN